MSKDVITDYTKGLVTYSGEDNAKDLIFEKTEALLSKKMRGIVHDDFEVKYIAEIYNHVLADLTETGEKIPTKANELEKHETAHLSSDVNLSLFKNKINRFLDENFIDQGFSSKIKKSFKRIKP
jgi:hypothetical protein